MSGTPRRLPLGIAVSLASVVACIAAACSSDRREPQTESAAAAAPDIAVPARETTKTPATATTPAPARDSSRITEPRLATKGTDRDTSPSRPPARRDTTAPPLPKGAKGANTEVRGTITVVGNAPVTEVQVRDASGANHTLAGPELPSLRRVAGLEVALRGSPSPSGELTVRDFTVLTADGQSALDGVLEHEANTLYLRTASRRVPLGNPPAELHGLVGARVWLTGSPERGPNTFGIITPPR